MFTSTVPGGNPQKRVELLMKDVVSLEDYVHDLFNFSPLPICFISPADIILEVNPAFEEVSGYRLTELAGSTIDKVLDEDKEVLITKEKEEVPVQVFTRARRNEAGEEVGYFLGLFDLTEIKETERELRDSQTALLNILEDTEESRQTAERERAKTQNIIENLSDALIVLDVNHRVSLANPKAEEFLSVRREEVEGRLFSELTAVNERTRKLVELVTEMGVDRTVSRMSLKMNDNLVLEMSNILVSEEAGRLLILHDVTREKIVEQLKTEFVSVAAHQLRTPLSAVKWSLRMLLDGDLGEMTDEQREFLDKTYRSNERMINLVNSLLNVARIEEGRFVHNPRSVDLTEMTETVVEEARSTALQKGVRLIFRHPEEDLPKTEVDEEKMRIVIQNLVANAVEYTPSGGFATISLESDGSTVLFKIKDSGVGIPEDQQDRVFSKFFRGENVVRMDTVGTGLGLFITKNIVRAHGGQIWFESKPDEGTTFWFELPVVE